MLSGHVDPWSSRDRVRVWPTRDGWVVLSGALGLAVVAWMSANNLLYMIAAPVWAAWLLSLPIGVDNLRRIGVRRVLPAELYAGRDAPGTLLIEGPRWGWGASALEVFDEGTGAVGWLDHVAPGATSSVAVRWRFEARGLGRLSAMVVRSSFPFGLLEHTRWIERPAQILVYPRPLPSTGAARSIPGLGLDDERAGGSGEMVDLRCYLPGDSIRRIHWPTTVRLGTWVVVERAQEHDVAVEIEVRPAATSSAWEREISQACGEVQRALASGLRVGLRTPDLPACPGQRLRPSGGQGWRRTLLDTLARLPRIAP